MKTKKIFLITGIGILYIAVLTSAVVFAYYLAYQGRVLPGVRVGEENLGNKTREEVISIFQAKNNEIDRRQLEFVWEEEKWEISGSRLKLGYNPEEISSEAYNIGRQGNIINKIIAGWNSYWHGTFLAVKINIDEKSLSDFLKKAAKKIDQPSEEGLFEFKNGKVEAFKLAADGRYLDIDASLLTTKKEIEKQQNITVVKLTVKTIKPMVSMEQANKLGIKELLGKGESYFKDSIPNRIYNIKIGTAKLHGILIAPDEIFSFNKNIGTISAFTGYKQAYVIEKGKTILGDGGGVCQVSTTIFRAALNAGLPIVERTAHSYRVGYYEPPIGFDATVYDPAPDFKFKNDTGKYILIQTRYEEDIQRLTFELYGTKDGRETTTSEPVIVSQQPAPTPTYQDDPNLAKGVEQQIDTAHGGAKVYFTRKVVRNGQELINETIWSNYIPWAAVILRGTKE